MKKIAQTLTFLFLIALLGSSCSNAPEDPRTWETPETKTKKGGFVQLQTKIIPVGPAGQIPHPIRNEESADPNENTDRL